MSKLQQPTQLKNKPLTLEVGMGSKPEVAGPKSPNRLGPSPRSPFWKNGNSSPKSPSIAKKSPNQRKSPKAIIIIEATPEKKTTQ